MSQEQEVRKELNRLRGATEEQLKEYGRELTARRVAWCQAEKAKRSLGAGDPLHQAYRLLLTKLGISEAEAPIVSREEARIVFHSRNFCPTLEACRILGLDTRLVCRLSSEQATDQMMRQLDPRLRFGRNYAKIRPYTPYCEENINRT